MHRRTFLQVTAAAPAAAAIREDDIPKYRVVSAYQAGKPGMPGLFPAKVASVRAPKSIDPETEKVDVALLAEMFRRGMTRLTGDKDPRDSWRRFVGPQDSIGIKLNCSGAPGICSHPAVVGEIVKNLVAVGVKPGEITLYERYADQVDTVPYAKYLPEGVRIEPVGRGRNQSQGYDPKTYVEVSFFGEEDTRSNLIAMVTNRFSKIINVPNMKDHGASGVTGCLKNIAYGNFSNVARSHANSKTYTYSFIGTLAAVEPLRTKTVLQVMDGLKGVWHGGPFSPSKKYRFYPARMMFGTDPVAIDRLLLDIIDDERKRNGAVSVWDRTTAKANFFRDPANNPNINRYVREPGHIEYATKFGLGTYDKNKIKTEEIVL